MYGIHGTARFLHCGLLSAGAIPSWRTRVRCVANAVMCRHEPVYFETAHQPQARATLGSDVTAHADRGRVWNRSAQHIRIGQPAVISGDDLQENVSMKPWNPRNFLEGVSRRKKT
jgi:hypothetical protein